MSTQGATFVGMEESRLENATNRMALSPRRASRRARG